MLLIPIRPNREETITVLNEWLRNEHPTASILTYDENGGVFVVFEGKFFICVKDDTPKTVIQSIRQACFHCFDCEVL